jgi:hypothetical protein
MPLAPKLFPEGTTERNTTLVSRLAGRCFWAHGADVSVFAPQRRDPTFSDLVAVCSASLLQIPAANVMHTGYNTTSLIVSAPRPAPPNLTVAGRKHTAPPLHCNPATCLPQYVRN